MFCHVICCCRSVDWAVCRPARVWVWWPSRAGRAAPPSAPRNQAEEFACTPSCPSLRGPKLFLLHLHRCVQYLPAAFVLTEYYKTHADNSPWWQSGRCSTSLGSRFHVQVQLSTGAWVIKKWCLHCKMMPVIMLGAQICICRPSMPEPLSNICTCALHAFHMFKKNLQWGATLHTCYKRIRCKRKSYVMWLYTCTCNVNKSSYAQLSRHSRSHIGPYMRSHMGKARDFTSGQAPPCILRLLISLALFVQCKAQWGTCKALLVVVLRFCVNNIMLLDISHCENWWQG